MKKIALAALLAIAVFTASAAEPCPLRFDRTVHNFGKVTEGDGPLSCEFTATNVSKTDAVLYAVATSCGCTVAEWTRETIAPGAAGTIKVTYANDEGPYPFDKVLTVYIKDTEKPILLHVKGSVSKKK